MKQQAGKTTTIQKHLFPPHDGESLHTLFQKHLCNSAICINCFQSKAFPGSARMPDPTLQRYSHKTFDPAPWPISEPNHCTNVFEKLRLQREQGRFCDVILKVNSQFLPIGVSVLKLPVGILDLKYVKLIKLI